MLNLKKVQAYQESNKVKSEREFCKGMPAFHTQPAGESYRGGSTVRLKHSAVFNNEAIALMGIFKTDDEHNFKNRILFVSNYEVEGEYRPILHPTSSKTISIEKVHNCYIVSEEEFRISSNHLISSIVEFFKLDIAKKHYFTIKQTDVAEENAFTINYMGSEDVDYLLTENNKTVDKGEDEEIEMIQE